MELVYDTTNISTQFQLIFNFIAEIKYLFLNKGIAHVEIWIHDEFSIVILSKDMKYLILIWGEALDAEKYWDGEVLEGRLEIVSNQSIKLRYIMVTIDSGCEYVVVEV